MKVQAERRVRLHKGVRHTGEAVMHVQTSAPRPQLTPSEHKLPSPLLPEFWSHERNDCFKPLTRWNDIEVKVSQSGQTCCDAMDYAVHGILQARILEWVAFPFFRGSSHHRDRTQVSHIAGGFFTSRATEESNKYLKQLTLRGCSVESGD